MSTQEIRDNLNIMTNQYGESVMVLDGVEIKMSVTMEIHLLKQIEDLVAKETNKARIDEVARVARATAGPKEKETWRDWSWRVLEYLEKRKSELKAGENEENLTQ